MDEAEPLINILAINRRQVKGTDNTLNAQKGHQKRATDMKAESQLSISIGKKHSIRLTNTVIHLTPCQVRGDWSAKERKADDDFYEGNRK